MDCVQTYISLAICARCLSVRARAITLRCQSTLPDQVMLNEFCVLCAEFCHLHWTKPILTSSLSILCGATNFAQDEPLFRRATSRRVQTFGEEKKKKKLRLSLCVTILRLQGALKSSITKTMLEDLRLRLRTMRKFLKLYSRCCSSVDLIAFRLGAQAPHSTDQQWSWCYRELSRC